jgi:hypothetical protein
VRSRAEPALDFGKGFTVRVPQTSTRT